jgi:two-component system, NtrC family, sensor kinase
MTTLKPQVLVIDGDLDIQSFLIRTLGPIYRVKAVGDFNQALSELVSSAANPYDLVQSDILLPGISEVQLVGELHKRGFDLPVIVMTAQGSESRDARRLVP